MQTKKKALNETSPLTATPGLSTRSQEQAKKLWAFLVGTYWVSIVTYVILVKHYKRMIRLRGKEQAHAHARPQQFACLVRDIPAPPKHMARREQVDAFFKKLHSDTYQTCMIVTNVKKVNHPKTKTKPNFRPKHHSS
jgi:hypothetical protein